MYANDVYQILDAHPRIRNARLVMRNWAGWIWMCGHGKTPPANCAEWIITACTDRRRR